MSSNQEEIEIEIDSELLTIIRVVAMEQGISAEECIGEIVQAYIKEKAPPGTNVPPPS